VIKAMNANWHPDCFTCELCDKPLADVGFLRNAGPRGFTAYDADGQPLGLFAEKQAAVEAITAPNLTGD